MVWPRKIKKKKMRAILFLEKVRDLSTTKTLLPLTSKRPLAFLSPTTKLHESPPSSSSTSSLPLALEGQGSFSAINQKKSHPSKGSLTTRSINSKFKINSSLVSLDLKLPLTSFSRRIQPIRSFETRPSSSNTQRQFFLQCYYGEVLVIHSFLQILLRTQILDMGSIGNQNLWPPYDSSKGCTQGICSIYCPQWCYNFPPPVDDDSGTPFSPLIIAIIGILAIAFLLVSYYTIVKRYCRRRNDPNTSIEPEENLDGTTRDQWAVASTGLDEALIKTITVCKYKKGDGLIEGTECAVCLSEFQENESLRLLPKCIHAFHLPCIDTWLKSHSSCPLCRVDVNLTSPSPPPAPSSQTPSTLNLASLEVQRPDDLIFVVDDHGRDRSEEVVLTVFNDDNVRPKSPLQNVSTTQDSETRNDIIGTPKEDVIKFRRSISSGTFSSQGQLMIADILRIEEAYEGLQMESSSRRVLEEESKNNTNNNSRDWELMRSPVAMRRSISTGRFLFTVHNKGYNSIFPH